MSIQEPANLDIHRRLGFLYIESKQYDRAIEEFRIVLAARPADVQIRYYLAVTLEEVSRYKEAAEELKKVIAVDPKT